MNQREDIVKKFSTFFCFNSKNCCWQAELELEHSMQYLVQSDPDAKAEFWARYFLKVLREISSIPTHHSHTIAQMYAPATHRSHLRAEKHISAYLQEACLWAAQKTHKRLSYLKHKYVLEDYFQIANLASCLPAKLLKTFNLEYSQSNIEGYAKTAILRFVSDKIYCQDIEAKRQKFSDYGLLKDLSAKELKEALILQGITSCQLDLHSLAWRCFDDIYQPDRSQVSRILEPPTQEDLQQIVAYYNKQRDRLNFPTAIATTETIQAMLTTCIQAARDRRTMQFLPLDNYSNISDFIPTPLDTAIQIEEQEQVKSLIVKLFTSMPIAGQILFTLWQGLNLTQAEIAAIVQHKYPEMQKQYQVARQLGRYTTKLLQDFLQEWNQLNPDTQVQGDRDLEYLKNSLIECLRSHCVQSLNSILEKIKIQLFDENKVTSFQEQEIQKNLIDCFYQELAVNMNTTKKSLSVAEAKIATFIHEWLKSEQVVFKI